MDHMSLLGRTEVSVPPLSVLRRPLPNEGPLFWGRLRQVEDLVADLLDSLDLAADDGDERAEKEAIAEALIHAVIFQSMALRMLDEEKGAVPRFVRQLGKSVRSFQHQLG